MQYHFAQAVFSLQAGARRPNVTRKNGFVRYTCMRIESIK